MSHAATNYVKHLVRAPNGEKITASEKTVLGQLADDHREELGVAWPSLGNLAKRCCLSERQTRRIIAGLERKGVVRRIPNKRDTDGGQTSNEYVFRALGLPPTDAKLVAIRCKLQKVPRLPMSARQSQKRPVPAAGSVTPPRVVGSGAPGRQRPPIESLVELLRDSSVERLGDSSLRKPKTIPPTPHASAGRVNDKNLSLEEQRESAFGSLSLARLAWTDAMKDLHSALLGSTPLQLKKRPESPNGADDWKSFRLDDVAVESVGERSGGTVELVLSSPEPKATELGLQKYRSRIARALNKWYGRDVRLVLRGTEVQMSEPLEASGSNAAGCHAVEPSEDAAAGG